MRRITSCLVCSSDDLASSPAIVAPFIREYALGGAGRPEVPTHAVLLTCASCEMDFYDLRYDDDEIAALYAGYRGERYFTLRHHFEPLYTRKYNDNNGRDSAAIDTRKRTVQALVTEALGTKTITSVLDFGGDAGQFIPDFEGAARYVLEVSDVPPEHGVMSVSRLEELEKPVDLVMLAHVLEHVSDPVALLTELTTAVGDGGYLYVEVPLDRPKMPPPWAARLQASWVKTVTCNTRLTVAVDAVSTPVRVLARGRWIPFTFPRLHEHINFFSPGALARTLERGGWHAVAQKQYAHNTGLFGLSVLGVLATRAVPSTEPAAGKAPP